MVFFRLFAGEAPLDADAAPPDPPACFLHVRDAGAAARPPSAFMVREWPGERTEAKIWETTSFQLAPLKHKSQRHTGTCRKLLRTDDVSIGPQSHFSASQSTVFTPEIDASRLSDFLVSI